VREGRFKGSYKLNIKEQLAQRAVVEKRKLEKVRVVMVGGSQMGRIAQELTSMGKDRLDVVGRVHTKGRVDMDEISNALRELAEGGVEPDKVIVVGLATVWWSTGRRETEDLNQKDR
jgi:hypothetical protein